MRVAALIAVCCLALTARAEAPFVIGQLHYDGGGDWYSGATSIGNWLAELQVRVGLNTAREARVVRPTGRDLATTPFVYVNGHGNMRFSDAEAVSLRRYLLGGGFMFVNDDYGLDESFRREMARVLPGAPLEPIPATHFIYHCFYDLDGLPKIHEHDGEPAQGYGIFLNGRLALFYAYSADIGDGLEEADVHGDPAEAREHAARMATNIVVYALTH
ncbi:hypothetical protein CMK11_15100 [Candidatus Poribacteria bacterium]|nr:hypothetical protein [Candidatus Poribacteria bacterium]